MKKILVLSLAVNVFFGIFLIMNSSFVLQVEADCTVAACARPPCCNGDVNGDAEIDLSDAVSLLAYLFADGNEPAKIDCFAGPGSQPPAATGLMLCYDSAGAVVDCGDEHHPGQDGFYQKGCPLEGRFTDNNDGTVTDNCTGLTWQRASAPGEYTWAEALQYCEDLALGGETDWRLPNVRELHSIVDYGRDHPAIDPVFESGMAWYWSSTTLSVTPTDAWAVNFGYGGAVNELGKTGTHPVRAVRG